MPKTFAEVMARGSKYKFGLTSLAAETQHGHTTMLTGAFTNNTGLIGNGYYNITSNKTIGVVLDPNFRLAETLIEAIEPDPTIKTAFISGKWRLSPLLSLEADLIFASPILGIYEGTTFIPLPDGYLAKLGTPITFADGDIIDPW